MSFEKEKKGKKKEREGRIKEGGKRDKSKEYRRKKAPIRISFLLLLPVFLFYALLRTHSKCNQSI